MHIVAIAISVCLVSLSSAADAVKSKDNDEEVEKLPGLLAIYNEPLISRYDAQPAIDLDRGQTPDPRLKSKNWSVLWKGVLRVPRQGRYSFFAEHNGSLNVYVNGKTALDASAVGTDAQGASIELPVGIVSFSVVFKSTDKPSLLRLFWQSDKFPRERISPTAFGHLNGPTDPGEQLYLGSNSKFVVGRLKVEEHSCAACHWPSGAAPISGALVNRLAPRLKPSGSRLKASWIYHWLENPQSIRPEATMPRLFTDDKRGEVERYAVARFLSSPESLRPERPFDAKLVAEGEQLFNRLGCRVCHDKHGAEPARSNLVSLVQKTTVGALADYLRNPLEIDPTGRMPSFNLSDRESRSLAEYLLSRDGKLSRSLDLPAAPNVEDLRDAMLDYGILPAKEALKAPEIEVRIHAADLGARIVREKKCVNCHEIKSGSALIPAFAAKHDFGQICENLTGGCLVPLGTKPDGKHPVFGLSLDREAVLEFLETARHAPATPSPGEDARLTLQRYNCLGCHERNGEGGLAPDVVKSLVENQTQETAEMVSPPSLTGVAGKLRESYLRGVLLDGKRSRPWMSLRMPQFPREVMAALPAGLAALDAEPLDDKAAHVDQSSKVDEKQLAEAGRTLVGSRGFGCTKCHDMLGVPSGGTRGPDLSLVGARVKFEWFDRWMTDPQRIQPGTRMPTVFLNGASPYKDILDGDPAMQRLAVWHYLSNSKKLPPPEGLEPPKAAEVGPSVESYQCVRTFLPDVTPRSMGIRYRNGVHLAYDLQACRLAYGWSGDFLDMSPVWNDRGGNPARLKGPVFWHSPAGFPWDVTASAGAVPDFTARGTETSLGAALPYDGKLHPTRLDFRGYHLDEAGPTFRFELQLDGGSRAKFTEQVISLQTPSANGALRRTTAAAPANQTIWVGSPGTELEFAL